MSLLYTRCRTCDANHTVPEPAEPWEDGRGVPLPDCVIPCPTCGEPLSILGTALVSPPKGEAMEPAERLMQNGITAYFQCARSPGFHP